MEKKRKILWDCSSKSSESSRISATHVRAIMDKLLLQQTQSSTSSTYLQIWRQFNKFLIDLDSRPDSWEDRVSLFIAYKIKNGMQSATVKSCVSAIKKILVDDGYHWDDQKILLTSLTKACRLVNDRVHKRFGISFNLLELILFKLQRHFTATNQYYLETMYKAIFCLGYYGLMRIGELTWSNHIIRAANVHIAWNKHKILLILYSSKTHSIANRPQKNQDYIRRKQH